MRAYVPEGPTTGSRAADAPKHPKHPEHPEPDRVIFFDLDNTLYSKALGIHNQMAQRIQLYFQTHLDLPAEESRRLGAKYYLDYGLAVRGLIRHFQVDPSAYNAFVDGGLRLEGRLQPTAELSRMLGAMRGTRKWVFTNAGLGHAQRVLGLLGVAGCFEGIIYCDYGEPDFPAKPDRLAYERAMHCAGIAAHAQCYFVDDSANNVRVAAELGWRAVHLAEPEQDSPSSPLLGSDAGSSASSVAPAFPRISRLGQLADVFPELFPRAASPSDSVPAARIEAGQPDEGPLCV